MSHLSANQQGNYEDKKMITIQKIDWWYSQYPWRVKINVFLACLEMKQEPIFSFVSTPTHSKHILLNISSQLRQCHSFLVGGYGEMRT